MCGRSHLDHHDTGGSLSRLLTKVISNNKLFRFLKNKLYITSCLVLITLSVYDPLWCHYPKYAAFHRDMITRNSYHSILIDLLIVSVMNISWYSEQVIPTQTIRSELNFYKNWKEITATGSLDHERPWKCDFEEMSHCLYFDYAVARPLSLLLGSFDFCFILMEGFRSSASPTY